MTQLCELTKIYNEIWLNFLLIFLYITFKISLSVSITPVLCRSLERCIVRRFIYPVLHQPPPGLDFQDQFAFRPSGSTAAAIIPLLHTICTMLSDNQYVRVFSFDFTKAFDTVRHAALMNKLALLPIPDDLYNWIKDFFEEHYHCTRYAGECSLSTKVKASVMWDYGLMSYIH